MSTSNLPETVKRDGEGILRDYSKIYRKYHSSPSARQDRSDRNKARRTLGLKKGDGKEADHKRPLSKGGSNRKDNLRAVSRHTNRSRSDRVDETYDPLRDGWLMNDGSHRPLRYGYHHTTDAMSDPKAFGIRAGVKDPLHAALKQGHVRATTTSSSVNFHGKLNDDTLKRAQKYASQFTQYGVREVLWDDPKFDGRGTCRFYRLPVDRFLSATSHEHVRGKPTTSPPSLVRTMAGSHEESTSSKALRGLPAEPPQNSPNSLSENEIGKTLGGGPFSYHWISNLTQGSSLTANSLCENELQNKRFEGPVGSGGAESRVRGQQRVCEAPTHTSFVLQKPACLSRYLGEARAKWCSSCGTSIPRGSDDVCPSCVHTTQHQGNLKAWVFADGHVHDMQYHKTHNWELHEPELAKRFGITPSEISAHTQGEGDRSFIDKVVHHIHTGKVARIRVDHGRASVATMRGGEAEKHAKNYLRAHSQHILSVKTDSGEHFTPDQYLGGEKKHVGTSLAAQYHGESLKAKVNGADNRNSIHKDNSQTLLQP